MTNRTNGIATAADFRQLTRFELVLPSGRKVRLATVSLKFTLTHVQRFQTLAARMAEADKAPPTEQEAEDFEAWLDLLLADVVIEPKVSLHPKDESELHPREIPALDRLVIFRRAVGEVGADGADLAEFHHDAAGTGVNDRATGDEIPHASSPVPGPDGNDGVPD